MFHALKLVGRVKCAATEDIVRLHKGKNNDLFDTYQAFEEVIIQAERYMITGTTNFKLQ